MNSQSHNRVLHNTALFVAIATFPLIFIGGLVTSHQAGMSVPDWPNSWGYNMFTFPIKDWVGGIFYEHTHRLYASFIGFLTIVLAVVAWVTDKRPVIRWTAIGIFLACFAQGILGGLRVVLSAIDLAIIHGCAAQIFFCLVATFCVMTSPLWTNHPELSPTENKSAKAIRAIALVTTLIVVTQLVIGALMRHSGAGLAIPDFPASFGHILPPTTLTPEFRQDAIHQFGTNLNLNQVTLFQIWIHFAHRLGAIAVTVAIITLAIAILINQSKTPSLTTPAYLLLLLLATQLTLGILTVLLRKPADIASAHVAVGALVLMTTWVIVVRAQGLLRPTEHAEADTMPIAGSGLRAVHSQDLRSAIITTSL